MSIRKSGEAHHNTYDEVVAWLEQSVDALTKAEVPPELWPVAFPKAYDSLSAKQINYEVVQGGLGLMQVPRG